jgi:hypothetical protein
MDAAWQNLCISLMSERWFTAGLTLFNAGTPAPRQQLLVAMKGDSDGGHLRFSRSAPASPSPPVASAVHAQTLSEAPFPVHSSGASLSSCAAFCQ